MTLSEKVQLANRIANSLAGTCMRTLEQELEDSGHPELEDDLEFLRLFDERCFECAQCGWWHGAESLSDYHGESGHDLICDECEGENFEPDEDKEDEE